MRSFEVNPIHVFHIETGRSLYGGALQVLYLLGGLSQRGIQGILIAPEDSAIIRAAKKAGYRYLEVKYSGDLDPRLLFAQIKAIRSLRKEVSGIIHVHSRRGADLWGVIASMVTGLPLVITRRVDNPENAVIARLKYRHAAAVVAISRAISEILRKAGCPRERIRLIYSAVDTSIYRPDCLRTWFRQTFNLDEGDKAVGMVAQFIPRKGHAALIRAIPGILSRERRARFLFFGKGPLEGEMKALSRELGVDRVCSFLGFRDDLPRILPCLDLLVHPALMEGLGVAILQAMACGVPVVAARAGGIPEILEKERGGMLLDSKEPDSMIEELQAIVPLALDREKRELEWPFLMDGRKEIKRRFSIEQMTQRYISLYREVISSG